MFCTQCGSNLEENQQFCSECGAKLDTVPIDQPVVEPVSDSVQTQVVATGMIQPAYVQAPVQVPTQVPAVAPVEKERRTGFIVWGSLIIGIVVLVLVGLTSFLLLNNNGKKQSASSPHKRISNVAVSHEHVLSEAGKQYKKVLNQVSEESNSEEKYYYALWDMNNDTIPDLVIASARNTDTTGMISATYGMRIVSYTGKKLVRSENLAVNSDLPYGTLYFNKHHDGVVVLSPTNGETISGESLPWKKTVYRLTKHQKFTEDTNVVSHPLASNSEFDTSGQGTDELGKLVMPAFISVDDMSGIDALIDSETSSAKQREHYKTMQDWIEQGYQVYTGKVQTLSAEEANSLPGVPADDAPGGESYDKDAKFTVLVLDQPASVTVSNGFMGSALRPTIMFSNRVAVLLHVSTESSQNNLTQYEGKHITLAVRPNGIGYHGGDVPFGQPSVEEDTIQVIK